MRLQNNLEKESILENIKGLNEVAKQLIKNNEYSKEGIKTIRPQLIELLEDIKSGKFLEDYNVTEEQMIELKDNFQIVVNGMNEFEKNIKRM